MGMYHRKHEREHVIAKIHLLTDQFLQALFQFYCNTMFESLLHSPP